MSTIASNVYQSTAENSPKLIQYLHSFGVGLGRKWSQTSLLGIKKNVPEELKNDFLYFKGMINNWEKKQF